MSPVPARAEHAGPGAVGSPARESAPAPAVSASSSGAPRYPRPAAPRLSVVVPCYDEAGNVPLLAAEIHEALAAAGIEDYEVIFVDDGSTDGTAREVKEEIARDLRVRLVSLERNSGLSSAIEAGFRRARGDAIAVIDGDMQADPRDIPRLLAALGPDCDCACGVRVNRRAGDNFVKRASSAIANFVRTCVLRDAVTDAGCTTRVLKRECIERVKLFRGMHRFLPTLLRYEGYGVKEIPVNHRPRRFGKSKYGVLNRAFAAAYDLMAVRWMRSRVVPWKIREEA